MYDAEPITRRHRELYSRVQTPWVESPTFETELDRCDLSDDLKRLAATYHRDGFAVFDPEIAGFDSLADEIRRLEYRGEGRLTNAWESNATVRALAVAPRVLELLRALYRREPIPYQTLNFPVGTEQRTHSDSVHFASVPSRYMCGVWIALEDTDSENGPLHYYPGSHRLPILGVEDMGIDATIRSARERYAVYEQFIAHYVRANGLRREELHLRKGQAAIWAANLLHGGSPIRDRSRSRHSQVTHYFFERCQYYAPIQSTVFRGKIQFIRFRNILDGRRVDQPKPPWFNYHRLTTRHRVRQVLSLLRLADPS